MCEASSSYVATGAEGLQSLAAGAGLERGNVLPSRQGTQFTCFTGSRVQILTQKALQLFKQQSSIEPIDRGVVGGRCSNFDAVASFNEGQGLMNVWVNQKSFAFEPTGEGRRYTHTKNACFTSTLLVQKYTY